GYAQHRALWNLAHLRPDCEVAYSAPLFSTLKELEAAIVEERVQERTMKIPLRSTKSLHGRGPHSITYDLDGRNIHTWSEPTPAEGAMVWTRWLQVPTMPDWDFVSNEPYLERLGRDVAVAVSQAMQVEPNTLTPVTDRGPIAQIVYLAAKYLDAAWYIV